MYGRAVAMNETSNESGMPKAPEAQSRFTRRDFLKGATAVTTGIALGETAIKDTMASPERRPPEILIRYGDEDLTDSQQKEVSEQTKSNVDRINKIKRELKPFNRE